MKKNSRFARYVKSRCGGFFGFLSYVLKNESCKITRFIFSSEPYTQRLCLWRLGAGSFVKCEAWQSWLHRSSPPLRN